MMTPLQKKRLQFVPRTPSILKHLDQVHCHPSGEMATRSEIATAFPHLAKTPRYGIVRGTKGSGKPLSVGALFSGGPASGGHNVLSGLFDGLKQMNQHSKLIGFLGGFSGLLENRFKELTVTEIDTVRNQGGFDLIGSGRVKLETAEHLHAAMLTAKANSLDAIIVIGGDDSNTNAAVLAEYLVSHGSTTRVIGIPKTIDGDLRSSDIELSFGFDTACKIYSEMIGNIERDARSSLKYYHFIKLMGRSASHIALECALLTQPNLALIGEEEKSLEQIVSQIADLIVRRKAANKEYGVILIPEGLIEFIPEMRHLISELNELVASGSSLETDLSQESRKTFQALPEKIQKQLILDRDPHGNVRVSQIATEQLLMELVKRRLIEQHFKGNLNFQEHFLGYEGRCGLPTNFDADYAYTLGLSASLAVRDGLTAVICAIRFLKELPDRWEPRFVPIFPLMRLEQRKGKVKPVIDKALVDLKGSCFVYFSIHKKEWEVEDRYQFQGPVQFFGDPEIVDILPFALTK